MKKILFPLIALVASMSLSAQVMTIKKNGVVVDTYTLEQADEVVFAEATEPETTGTAKATIGGSEVDVPWVQLWASGPKFAKYNVGVTDGKEESYGGYYCWGGSIDKDPNKKCNEGNEPLTGDDDTATNLWGSNWRMPTNVELQALLDKCDYEWTEDYKETGIAGLVFTGKDDYSENSLFLPAAGLSAFIFVSNVNITGNYRTSIPALELGNATYYLYFKAEESQTEVEPGSRDYGESVRAVLVE